MDNICNRCKSSGYLQAFSNGKCKLCNSDIVTPHIPCYELCDKCAKENELCTQCGKYIKICKAYIKDMFKAAKEIFCDGIYVKSDAHPCGWDFISFERFETPEELMEHPVEINDISNSCYDYHEYADKTIFEILKTVGMEGWCFEISSVDSLK